MDSIFNVDSEDHEESINIDSLYQTKKNRDLNTLSTYKRVLSRVHAKIKAVSRVRENEECCWYLVPEVIIGLPRFDNASCIAYLIHQLKLNGFMVRYTHPNLLFIAWNHWTPDYVREEFRKRTGVAIDGLGNRKPPPADKAKVIFKQAEKVLKPTSRDIKSYAPTGKLLYNSSQLPRS